MSEKTGEPPSAMAAGDCSGGIHQDPPPTYDTAPGNTNQSQYQQQPPAPPCYDILYEEPKLQGIPVEFQAQQVQAKAVVQLPKLAYADFLPRCIQQGTKEIPPKFDSFRSVIAGLNFWLQANPMYFVVRCETLERRWANHAGVLETETTVTLQPSGGHIGYVRGVRIWLVPSTTGAPQQIGYINLVPEEAASTGKTGYVVSGPMGAGAGVGIIQTKHNSDQFPNFKDLDETLAKFNGQLTANPIPGKVLSIETFDIKYKSMFEPKEIDPDASTWIQHGCTARFYLSVVRLFYLVGPSEPIAGIGLHDIVPEQLEFPNNDRLSFTVPKFENVPTLMKKAAQWMKEPKNMRVTNIQTWFTKISHGLGYVRVRNRSSSYCEGCFDSTFLQVVRVGYVIPFSTTPQGAPPVVLTHKTFVPLRTSSQAAETTSQTVERLNTWLNLTGVRVLGAETLQYEHNQHSVRIDTEKPHFSVYQRRIKYWISSIRLYLDGAFQEPPAHMMPPVPLYEYEKQNKTSSGACALI